MKPFVLLVQLAIGTSHSDAFTTLEQCESARRQIVARLSQTHVVTASGCFPRQAIEAAIRR